MQQGRTAFQAENSKCKKVLFPLLYMTQLCNELVNGCENLQSQEVITFPSLPKTIQEMSIYLHKPIYSLCLENWLLPSRITQHIICIVIPTISCHEIWYVFFRHIIRNVVLFDLAIGKPRAIFKSKSQCLVICSCYNFFFVNHILLKNMFSDLSNFIYNHLLLCVSSQIIFISIYTL